MSVTTILIIVLVIVLLGGGGLYYRGENGAQWGSGIGILGAVLVIALILLLVRGHL